MRCTRDIRRICEHPTTKIASGSPTSPVRLARSARLRDAQLQGRELHPAVPVAEGDARSAAVRHRRRRRRAELEIAAIHDASGYRRVRELLASQYNLSDREPNIQIVAADIRGDRSLTLRHTQHQRRTLNGGTDEVLKHMHRLWGFPVHLESISNDQVVNKMTIPANLRLACPRVRGNKRAIFRRHH